MHGQIIHEAKILEKGTYEISEKISKDIGVELDNAYKLLENFSKISEEGRPSGKILEKYIEDFSLNLSKIVSTTIFQFERDQFWIVFHLRLERNEASGL